MSTTRIATVLIALYTALFLFADFFAVADPAAIDPSLPYLPPEAIRFTSSSGRFHLRPLLVRRHPIAGQFAAYSQQQPALIPLRFFVFTASPDDPSTRHLRICAISDGAAHFLGTDEFGRDVWSRLVYGGRLTLLISLSAALAATLVALAVGIVAGYSGPLADSALMRLVEACMAVPWLYLLLAVRALLPLRSPPIVAAAVCALVMAAIGWARPARILRGAAHAARQSAYVTLARATGASPWHIARWHLLPALAPLALTQFTVLVPQFIAGEIALSYFGLGVTEPLVSWGDMLAAAQHLSAIVQYPWLMAPIWAMIPLFFAIHIFADRSSTRSPLTLSSVTRHWYKLPRQKVQGESPVRF
ncbi:MAG: ABC transporter permease [Acidobacteriota bacterium]|nr:ABC transporter permease [Acidobacteriota bacterium]